MGIEGGSNSKVQNQEINQANNEQNEINQAEHQRSGEELEGNSTIDNEGERKQIEGKDDATESTEDESSQLDKEDNIEDDPNTEQPLESDNVAPEQQLDNQDTIESDPSGADEMGEDDNETVDSLDNDGEIDTTVTPTINPGVIQDDEKSPEITVESCNAGISNSNTINPNIVITNNSDKPLKMSDITINYVFNADNKENLEYHCDWLAVDNQYLGNTSVCEFVNDDYGNTYAKIKFNTDVELQPNKQFVIHFRLNAADWSNWDTSNDYSMGTEQLLPNDKIIVFYNEQLISGVQP